MHNHAFSSKSQNRHWEALKSFKIKRGRVKVKVFSLVLYLFPRAYRKESFRNFVVGVNLTMTIDK